MVAGSDGGAESAELESVLGEVGIAWTGDGAFFWGARFQLGDYQKLRVGMTKVGVELR